MKTYIKPIVKITIFKPTEKIAAASIFEYTDEDAVPVTIFEINQDSWNSYSAGS